MTLLPLTGTNDDTPERGTAAVSISAVGAVIHVYGLVQNQCAVIKRLSQVFCPKKFHSTRIGREPAVN